MDPSQVENTPLGNGPVRDSLQIMSSNDMNIQANSSIASISVSVGGSPIKRSSIPRPKAATPTKTTAFVTEGGFLSPDCLVEKPRPETSPSPKPTNHNPSTVVMHDTNLGKSLRNTGAFSKSELESEIKEREECINELGYKILSMMTEVRRLEPDYMSLKETHSQLYKESRMKSNRLKNIGQRKESEIEKLKGEHEMKLRDLEFEWKKKSQNYEEELMREFTAGMAKRFGELNKEKDILRKKLDSINNEIVNHESLYEESLKTIEDEARSEMLKIITSLENSRSDYVEELEILKKQAAEIDSLKEESRKKQESVQKAKEEKELELIQAKDMSQLKINDIYSIERKIKALKESIASKNNTIQQLESQMKTQAREIIENDEQLLLEEETRRKLHNKLQELKGNIRVFCRVRPPLVSERGNDVVDVKVPDNDEEDQEIEIIDPKSLISSPFPTSSYNSNANTVIPKKSSFKFDRVFQMDSTNAEIFDEISQLVQTAIYGFNVCIFAYGQTGSGKTFTMSNKDGMIPRAIDQIFETCDKLKTNNNWEHRIYGEVLEIYNENINDLLNGNQNGGESNKNKYEIRHDLTNGKTSITDLTKVELTSPKMTKGILEKVYLNRSIGATKSNERSSRSHSVYIIRIEGQNSKTGETTSGVLNLIDLAGSERLTNSQAVGERLKETQSINKSLSCLGDVIYALGDENNGRHIPFRNSKLTYLLQFSLSGESKTLMFVNVSPLVKHYNETVNSLRFAMKVYSTKIKK